MIESKRSPLLALIGPTAVGKTAISVQLAKRYPIEIVSADSRLLYRGLDIGTAKPTSDERGQIPHHLIDVTDPDQPWSLSDYRQAAEEAIGSIHRREKIPMLVGGTGQYVAAVLEGWQPPPRAATDEIRNALEKFVEREGSEALHSRLETIDPISAARIDHRNVRRVIRALEIYEVTGKVASDIRIKQAPPYEIMRIGIILPRDELYRRIDERIDEMVSGGWIAEVHQLLSHGYDFNSPVFSAIGYRQMARFVRGEQSQEQVKAEIKRLSRQFVRRQANWFKANDPGIQWFTNKADVIDEIEECIDAWLVT